MKRDTPIIALNPPRDGKEYDCQCARCGSSVEFEPCHWCDGAGCTEPGELYEEDPNYYGPEDVAPCHECGGSGGDWFCLSSAEWCEANPLEGREATERGKVEWFEVSRPEQDDL